jgi:hypothetical protein
VSDLSMALDEVVASLTMSKTIDRAHGTAARTARLQPMSLFPWGGSVLAGFEVSAEFGVRSGGF